MGAVLAGPTQLVLQVAVAAVIVSMVLGAVDILRQPGWAWRRSGESRPAYLVLDLLVPIAGLWLYLVRARPKVAVVVAGGRAASLPFERFDDDLATAKREDWVSEAAETAYGFGSFGAAITANDLAELAREVSTLDEPAPPEPAAAGATPAGASETDARPADEPGPGAAPAEISSTFFSSGSSSRSLRAHLSLVRGYRPRQRDRLPDPVDADGLKMAEETPVAEEASMASHAPVTDETAMADEAPAAVPDGMPRLRAPGVGDPVPGGAVEDATAPTAAGPPAATGGSTAVAVAEAPVAEAPADGAPADETVDVPVAVPPGWMADPSGRHQYRYWDGLRWTENVADAGSQSRDTVSA